MRLRPVVCAALIGLPAFAASDPAQPLNLPVKLKLQWNAADDNLSIYAGVNGGHPVPYLFDTGSDAFVIAPSTWVAVRDPKPVTTMKTPDKMMYGDGTYGYSYLPVWARIAFYDPGFGRPALVLPNPQGYQVGRIIEQYSDYEPGKHIDDKSKATDDTGVFGARMLIASGGDDYAGTYQLANPIAQIPCVGGYVVTDNGPRGTASVTIGLNKAIRDQFPQRITLNKNDDIFPYSNLHSCDEATVDLTFSKAGHEPVTIQTILGLDTGSSKGYSLALTSTDASTVNPYLENSNDVQRDKNTKVTKIVKVGTLITFSFPGRKDGFHYSFRSTRSGAHFNSGVMYVTVEDAPQNDVTAGIGFFEHFAVMYDLENGELGFRDTPPDLSEGVLHPGARVPSAETPFFPGVTDRSENLLLDAHPSGTGNE
jgi:hypothetical protein